MSISFMTSASMLNMSYQTSSSHTSIVNNGSIGNLNVGGGGNLMSTFGALDQASSGGSFASAYASNGKAFAMAGSTGGATAMAAAGPNGAFASAGTQGGQKPCNSNQQCNQQQDPMQAIMGFMQMMAQVMGLGKQQQPQQPPPPPQQNDPMAGNKQMGQNMEQMGKKMQLMGGDLKDDGILNHSNKPNGQGQKQKMMMAMAMIGMLMQSVMGGDNQQQNQNQFNTPFQMLS